jgi:hypothetical protein
MRRALLLAALAALVLWLLRRRAAATASPRVVVGFADGSSTTLAPGSPEYDGLVTTAAEALSR